MKKGFCLSGPEKGSFGKGSFQKAPFSRDSRGSPHRGKERRIRPDFRNIRDFRDPRDSSSEKTPFVMTPFVMTPFSTPDFKVACKNGEYVLLACHLA